MRISAKLNKKRKKKRKKKQRKKESKAQKTENLKPVEREMAKQERRSFGVTRCRKGFGCRRSTPKRRTDQIKELRERERCQSKSCSLSLSLSLSLFLSLLFLSFVVFGRFRHVTTMFATYPDFFQKKKKKEKKKERRRTLVGYRFQGCLTGTRVGYVSDTGTWPKSPCSCNIVQMYMILENQYNITHMRYVESKIFLEKKFHTMHELQQFRIIIDLHILYCRHYNSNCGLYIGHI